MRLRDFENAIRYRRVVRNPWQAATARSRGEAGELVPLRLRRGGQLWIRSRTSDIRVFKDVFVKDVYRLSRLRAGSDAGRKLQCVVDIGGHIGVFSARVAGLAERVIACEPMPENAALFRRNVESVPLPNVHLLERAVSSSGRDLTLFTSKNTAGHTVLHGSSSLPEESQTVQSTTLADVLDQFNVERCDFLKVDCEGGEYDILLSAGADVLERVERIAMEYHNVGSESAAESGEGVERRLRAVGFVVDRVPSKKHPDYGLLFAWRCRSW